MAQSKPRKKPQPPPLPLPWCDSCFNSHPGANSEECRQKLRARMDREDRIQHTRRDLDIGASLAEFLVELQERLEEKDAQIKALQERLDQLQPNE